MSYEICKSRFDPGKTPMPWTANLNYNSRLLARLKGKGYDPQEIVIDIFGIKNARAKLEEGDKWIAKNYPDKDLREWIIDRIKEHFQQYSEVSFKSALLSSSRNAIVYGTDKKIFGRTSFDRPIAELLQTPEGKNRIVERVRFVKETRPEHKILNDNLPQDLLQ
jgi:hypothetical protein